jgi:hypothetical protein
MAVRSILGSQRRRSRNSACAVAKAASTSAPVETGSVASSVPSKGERTSESVSVMGGLHESNDLSGTPGSASTAAGMAARAATRRRAEHVVCGQLTLSAAITVPFPSGGTP